ncbi:MAG TPA: hypothetical protein VGD64_14880, partial [Acidisarcina sp.]
KTQPGSDPAHQGAGKCACSPPKSSSDREGRGASGGDARCFRISLFSLPDPNFFMIPQSYALSLQEAFREIAG